MSNTNFCNRTSYYLTGYSKWPGYTSLPIWVLSPQSQPDIELSCTDIFVKKINKAVNEAIDKNGHVTYNTVEEFLASLNQR